MSFICTKCMTEWDSEPCKNGCCNDDYAIGGTIEKLQAERDELRSKLAKQEQALAIAEGALEWVEAYSEGKANLDLKNFVKNELKNIRSKHDCKE